MDKKKLLIVEDDDILRNAYKNKFILEGFEVIEATDGKQALEMAEEIKPHLILLDILMPNMDGFEFLKHYDAPAHPETKIVVFTNLADPEKATEAINLGAIRYITKVNVSPNDLLQSVKEIINE